MPPSPIQVYLKKIAAHHGLGNATEHTYRGDLEDLMRQLLPGVDVTNEPQRVIDAGAPDYVLTRKRIPLGYIEAKNVSKSLDDKAHREQLQRYMKWLDNLIFTNYLEFRFYRGNEAKPMATVAIAELRGGKIKPLPENFVRFVDLVKSFGAYQGQTITTAAGLAKRMADKALALAHVIANALAADEKSGVALSAEDGELQNQFKAFRETLIADIQTPEFADIYAQTVAYGMFAARLHDPTPTTFTRQEAAELIPQSNPFLRKLFQHIAGYDLDSRIHWIVDDLADIFRASEVHELMKDYGKATQKNDPFLHFYETFLGAYDAKLKKSRGVWYTPEPVVNFIVRAVDQILKKEFGLKDGLADAAKTTVTVDGTEKEIHKVQILDPAAGTGTFLADIIKHIRQDFRNQRGVWPDYVRNELVPRLHGFEILMASYAMAHVKLEMILNETGCKLRGGQRLQVFLADSLENFADEKRTHPHSLANWLVNEAKGADKIKRETPVMVVLGNPPYSGISANQGKWIKLLVEEYKYVDGDHFGEKKHWLDDDYVKFIRYGQHYIDRFGEGVLAYINNHGFIDNPTFRGMRWHLLRSFDKIFVMDLHGNTTKKEVSPDGSPDKNVFDIKQGVSINFFVKTGKKKEGALGEVFHYDLFGERKSKYEFLWNHHLSSVKFQKIKTPAPNYFFVPKDYAVAREYEKGFSIPDLMPVNVSGIVTMGDNFTIAYTKKELSTRLNNFLSYSVDEMELKQQFGLGKNYAKWVIGNKEKISLKNDGYVNITWRPFDDRWTYFDNKLIWRWRFDVMRHLLDGENIGLIFPRRSMETGTPVFLTRNIIDKRGAHSWAETIGYLAPLYLYPEGEQRRLDGGVERKPNLNAAIVKAITDKVGAFTPVDLLDYIYATLHSPTYRRKFREFLKIDFPRVPFPRDKKQFRALAKLGAKLRALHLMESAKLDALITAYPETGDNTVATVEFDAGKVWINKTQHFAKVPKPAWDFHIGGYQPAQKYLKDRKGRVLTWDEIKHYQKIIVALVETAAIMEKIDKTA